MANYVGINDVSRPITGGYVGVNDVARKLIKGYVGVNGVAKKIWDKQDPLAYFIEGNFTTYENELVTSIGANAFSGCTALTDISFPNATSIGDYAFYHCDALRVLRVGLQSDTVCTLGTLAIPSTIQTIYVPAALADAYKADKKWSSFADKIVGV